MANLDASHLFSVKGIVAVVTGGGSGLGRTIALALDANGASKVFVIGRREEPLIETASLAINRSIVPVPGDITSKESLQAAYETISTQTDHVDLLLANSGVVGPYAFLPPTQLEPPSVTEFRTMLWSHSMEDFSRVFEVNITGTHYTILAFLPLLHAASQRRPGPETDKLSPPLPQVIITSSIAAYETQPGGYAYSFSKAALLHMVRVHSASLVPYGIRVNGVAPGLFYTELASPIYQAFNISHSGVSDNSFPPAVIPVTRSGSPADIAGLIVWMTSQSGGYMNGTTVVIDGGRCSVAH